MSLTTRKTRLYANFDRIAKYKSMILSAINQVPNNNRRQELILITILNNVYIRAKV